MVNVFACYKALRLTHFPAIPDRDLIKSLSLNMVDKLDIRQFIEH